MYFIDVDVVFGLRASWLIVLLWLVYFGYVCYLFEWALVMMLTELVLIVFALVLVGLIMFVCFLLFGWHFCGLLLVVYVGLTFGVYRLVRCCLVLDVFV